MATTPRIPEGTQWGTFLRNHDELTLEMVTPEERQAMLGWYAPDPRMRANVGIRRRLAPLLDNSRAEIELIHALLLALPGSPFLYYGDEIGMGDNIWLDDRDASRTPMQWTPDRNAGFSEADPGKLYLPVLQSLVHHYTQTNVEAQLASSSSLLHWLRRMLLVRREHPAFGMGEFRSVDSGHESVFAFVREFHPQDERHEEQAETLVCIFNLSHTPAASTIDLPEFAGRGLREVFGGEPFGKVDDDGTYRVTLGSQDFFWLRVRSAPDASGVQPPTQSMPIITSLD